MAVALMENTKRSYRPKRGCWLYQRPLHFQETSFLPETETLIHSSLSLAAQKKATLLANHRHICHTCQFLCYFTITQIVPFISVDDLYYWGFPLSTLKNLTVFIKLLLLNFPIIMICEHIIAYIITLFQFIIIFCVHFVSATHSYF